MSPPGPPPDPKTVARLTHGSRPDVVEINAPPRPHTPLPPGQRPRQDSVRDSSEIRTDTLLANLYQEGQARRAAEEELRTLKAERAEPPETVIEVDKATTAHVVVAGQRWRLGVPIALLSPVLLFLWTRIQDYVELERQVKALNAAVASYEGRMAAHEKMASDMKGDIATLRETEAKLSGYIAGALPMAGVTVPGAESGAIRVDIDRDPDKPGTKRRAPVVTHTRVPAPPPAQ